MKQIYSKKLNKEIWVVSDEYAKRELQNKGIAKGETVYTENEVKQLSCALSDFTRNQVDLIKCVFDTASVHKI